MSAGSRVPREGRFAVSVEERDIDVRVAILPTAHDDSCVLRLLDRERSIADVDMLGFANDQRARYTDAIRKPRGLVVVSGPAGSGRTSTLYATMRSMNTPERSLSSVEDPIAYSVDGVKQLAGRRARRAQLPGGAPAGAAQRSGSRSRRRDRGFRIARARHGRGHRGPAGARRDARAECSRRAVAAGRHGRRAVPRRGVVELRRVATARAHAVPLSARKKTRAAARSCRSSAARTTRSKRRRCAGPSAATNAATRVTSGGPPCSR